MANIFTALIDFVKSIGELITAFFMTLWNLIQTVLGTIGSTFAELFHFVASTIKGAFSVVGETGNFLISNLLVIAIIGVGIVGYLRYQQNRGQAVVVGDKKLN